MANTKKYNNEVFINISHIYNREIILIYSFKLIFKTYITNGNLRVLRM